MIQTLKKNLALVVTAIALAFAFSAAALTSPVLVSAADIQNNLCSGADQIQLGGGSNCATATAGSEDNLNSLITNIVNIFSVVVGIIAVIMIIYGGFRYITSGGDSNPVGSAKNTIIYAIIGLVIVALAQIIVRFVLSTAV